MFDFFKSVASTTVAWCVFFVGAVILIAAKTRMGIAGSYSVTEVMNGLGEIVVMTAMIVYVPCAVAVMALTLLDERSRFWRVEWACPLAALMGPVTFYFWLSVYAEKIYVPGKRADELMLAVVSALAGGAFGFCYSWSLARGRRKFNVRSSAASGGPRV